MRELESFQRVRYTERYGTQESSIHFQLPVSSVTWCGKEWGPNEELVDDDEPVTCDLCLERVRLMFRWWFPRKKPPTWMLT